jgi:antitoxin PrlF
MPLHIPCKDLPYKKAIPMITSKLTSKAQTTIPQPIRAALHLKEGDTIAYAIVGEKVILSRALIQPVDDPFANFDEWSSEADRRAYADL